MYDKNGNKVNWWSDRMVELYEEKSQCFVEQFNEYKVIINILFNYFFIYLFIILCLSEIFIIIVYFFSIKII